MQIHNAICNYVQKRIGLDRPINEAAPPKITVRTERTPARRRPGAIAAVLNTSLTLWDFFFFLWPTFLLGRIYGGNQSGDAVLISYSHVVARGTE